MKNPCDRITAKLIMDFGNLTLNRIQGGNKIAELVVEAIKAAQLATFDLIVSELKSIGDERGATFVRNLAKEIDE